MLIVACREIISGDSGFSVEKSIVLGSGCSLGRTVSHAECAQLLSLPYGSSGRSTGGSTSLAFFSADFGFVSSISSCSDTLSSSRWSWSDSDSMLGGCLRVMRCLFLWRGVSRLGYSMWRRWWCCEGRLQLSIWIPTRTQNGGR